MKKKTDSGDDKHLVRQNRELKPVRLGRMKISPFAQREFRSYRAEELLADFDPDLLGNPEVSFRDGYYYIMDGQHRIAAVKQWLGDGWEDQQIDCWVATGLTESEEAEVFLKLNNRLAVDGFTKFKVSVKAGRPDETAVAAIVQTEGLVVSKQATAGSIRAVSTLMKVYKRNGAEALQRSLQLARDSYGDPGLDASVIDGFGLLCHRYNGNLSDKEAVRSLSNAHGGVNGLLGIAEQLKQKTGNQKAHCVAAAAVQIINRNRKGKQKLPDWWKNG